MLSSFCVEEGFGGEALVGAVEGGVMTRFGELEGGECQKGQQGPNVALQARSEKGRGGGGVAERCYQTSLLLHIPTLTMSWESRIILYVRTPLSLSS